MIWYVTGLLVAFPFLLGLVVGAWLNRYPWCEHHECPHRPRHSQPAKRSDP